VWYGVEETAESSANTQACPKLRLLACGSATRGYRAHGWNAVGPKAEIIRFGSTTDKEPDVPAQDKRQKRAKADHSIPRSSSRATDLKNFVREGKKNLQNATNHAHLFTTCLSLLERLSNDRSIAAREPW